MSESVLFTEEDAGNNKRFGIATLNVEKKLNSLTLEMVGLLYQQLFDWEKDEAISCVWLQGAGEKAFCAGGDVRCLRDKIVALGAEQAQGFVQDFFENEYRLDYLIHRYSKPIIAWGNGFVMGGGIGLLSGASHRIVTETSRMAMPEITIGLFPDVGGTWFLNHAPGRTGLFLGLTGAHFNAADALFVGLADRFIQREKKADVMAALKQQHWTDSGEKNKITVSAVLREYENLEQLPEGNVRPHYDLIQAVTDGETTEQVVENILAIESDQRWLQKAVATLKSGCPSTAHLVFQQLQRGKKLSLPEVFQMELVMAMQCALHPDFPEGVRALLVDKDGKPQWQHASVSEVPAEWVDAHFQAPWAQGANPLLDIR
ncbi:MAG: enoyl-CoA hydratase/isomerase family protein [Pseudomonadales bacterium]|nr:enoyl-CoA hydratase/isomerase family protein [Pseudomonadales bacterium]